MSGTNQQVRVSIGEALARGQYAPVAEALTAAFRQGQTPYQEAFQLVDAAAGEPHLLRPMMQQLVRSRPLDSRSWRVMTLCHRYLHEWRAAIEAIGRCRALGDYDADLRFTEASLRELLAEDAEVRELLHYPWPEALRPRAWAVRGRLWLRTGEYRRLVNELRPWLESRGMEKLPINQEALRACWKYLGQAYDHLAEHDAAFAAFARGAPTQGAQGQELFDASLQAFKALVQKPWCSSWTEYSATQQPIAFLVGFPRSGTTLLEQGLDAHPDIVALEERSALATTFEQFQLQAQKQSESLREQVRATDRLADKLELIYAEMASLNADSLATLRDSYWQAVSRYIDVPAQSLLLDKMPLNILYIPFILRLFPKARFIVALRDPADCVFSGFMQQFENNPAMYRLATLDSGARFYAQVMALFQQYRDVFELESQLHFVYYEQLVTDWQEVMTGVFQFLDKEWHDNVSDFQRHAMARGTLATPSYQDVVRPLTSRAAGRWRKYQQQIGEAFAPLAPYRKLWGYQE